MNQKWFINIVVVILVVVAIAGAVGYFALRKSPTQPIPPVVEQPSTTQITPPSDNQTPPSTVFSPTPKVPASITFQETGGGCRNIFVYKINKDGTAGISVSAEKEKLNFSTTENTFEIGKTDDLNVEILAGDKIAGLYCTDFLDPEQPKFKRFIGKSGKAIISISSIDESQPEWKGNYTTTVILKDVRFIEENGNNSDITVDELIFKDIRVGWLPG